MIVDLVIIGAVVALAAFGFRNGLVQAAFSLAGLALGLVVAIPLVGWVGRQIDAPGWRVAVVVGVLVLIANAGYVGGLLIGERVKRRIKPRGVHTLDHAAGGVLSTVLALVLVWMLALPLATSPIPGVASAVRDSSLLPYIDEAMPDAARALYDAIDDAIAAQGLPDVVGPLDQTNVAEVGPPDPGLVASPALQAVAGSVLKVEGHSQQCMRRVNGSGFVYEPGLVVTNAHVVAGTTSLQVTDAAGTHEASVVYADEHTDVAVLLVPGLQAAPIPLATERLDAGQDVAVAGHPGGGPYHVGAGKVRASGNVTGPSFRDDGLVTRDVYVLRTTVVPGNSGGPLLNLDGQVAGVIFGSALDTEEVGYALTLDQVATALEAGRTATQPVVTGDCYP